MSSHTARTDHGSTSALVPKLQTDATDDRTLTMREVPAIEFDCTLGADRPGHPESEVAIIVATDSVNNSCVSLKPRRPGARDEYVIQEMLNCIDRLGCAKAELKCDQELSRL